jgi:hypothetical protein
LVAGERERDRILDEMASKKDFDVGLRGVPEAGCGAVRLTIGEEDAELFEATSVTVVMGGRALGVDMDKGSIRGTFSDVQVWYEMFRG